MKKRYEHIETQVQVAEYVPVGGTDMHIVTPLTRERLDHIKEYEDMGYEMCGVVPINCKHGEMFYRFYWKIPK